MFMDASLQNSRSEAKVPGSSATDTAMTGVTVASLLEFCNEASMNIESGYCFSTAAGAAIDVLKIAGEGAEAALAEAGFKILSPEEVYVVDPS